MKYLNIVLLMVLAGVVSASTFTDVDNSQYWGKTGIPALTKALDANFAAIEAGTVTQTLAANKILVGNDSSNQTAMAVTGDVTITQDGTNVTTAIAAGSVVNADVGANAAIASTKLSGVAGDPSASGSVSGTTNTVTITVKDTAAATLAEQRLIRVWASETEYGAPSTNNIESLTLSGGTAIQTVTAAAEYVYMTATNGTATATVIGTAAGTNYINVADGGYVTSAAVVFE